MSVVKQFEDMDQGKRILLVVAVIAVVVFVRGADLVPERRISRREAIEVARTVREDPSAPARVRVTLDQSPPRSSTASGPVWVVTFDEGDREVSYLIQQLGGDVVGGSGDEG